jgi:hypothetical protein
VRHDICLTGNRNRPEPAALPTAARVC